MPASTRVFALPELLETILLHVATALRPTHNYRGPDYLNPATDLFVLQRVNKGFRDIIARNITLRRRMFLEPTPLDMIGPHQLGINHTVDWLISSVGVFNNGYELFGLTNALGMHRKHDQHEFDKSLEASWRKMKVQCIATNQLVEIGIIIWKVRNWVGCFGRGNGAILGEVHDGLQRLMPKLREYEDATEAHQGTWHHRKWPKLPSRRMRVAARRIQEKCSSEDMWEEDKGW